MSDRSQNSSATRKETENGPWRTLAVWVLIVLASVFTAAAVVAAWAQPLIYDTDTWVDTVGPLPQNQDVAAAVADNTVTALFESQDVEGKVKQALPPPAQFLAGPLVSQVQTQANTAAKNIVRSDQFNTIWVGANRIAHQQFLKLIENKADEKIGAARSQAQSVTLDLSGLREQVRSTLGISGQTLFNPEDLKGAASTADQVSLNLEKSIKKVREFATVVDRLNKVLPVVVISLFLAALAVSRRRQKTLLISGAALVVTSAVLLITLKAIKPEVEGMASNAMDQAALGAVWDQITHRLHTASAELAIPGVITILVALFMGPYAWAKQLRETIGLHKLADSKAASTWQSAREFVGRYQAWFYVAGLAIVLGTLLLLATVTVAGIVGAVALGVGYVSIIDLIRVRDAR